jgi:hypothetical protein
MIMAIIKTNGIFPMMENALMILQTMISVNFHPEILGYLHIATANRACPMMLA